MVFYEELRNKFILTVEMKGVLTLAELPLERKEAIETSSLR